MYADHRQTLAADDGPETGAAIRMPPPVPIGTGSGAAAFVTSRYEGGRNRSLVLLILLGHAVALLALARLDVVHLRRPPAPRLMSFEIRPDTPPPARPRPRPAAPAKVVSTAPAVPPPVIVAPSPAPPPLATMVAHPAPAPVAAPPAAPAPAIVPPDGSAATLRNPPPRYPTESRRLREQGTVRLRLLISAAGEVEQLSIARSSGHERLDRAAVEAVRHWRFVPGMQAGRPVEAIGFLSIPFVLTG